MRSILFYILTPLITVLLVVVKTPIIEKTFFDNDPDTYNQVQDWVFLIFVILATSINTYVSFISPFRTLQVAQRKGLSDLTSQAKAIIAGLESKYKYKLSYNIMVPRLALWTKTNKRKWELFPKVFMVVWEQGEHVSSRLRLSTKQGACGMAYREEKPIGFDIADKRNKTGESLEALFNMTKEQAKMTEKIVVVASSPILLRRDRPNMQKTSIIGVINVECCMEKSGEMVSDNEKWMALVESLEILGLSYVASRYH